MCYTGFRNVIVICERMHNGHWELTLSFFCFLSRFNTPSSNKSSEELACLLANKSNSSVTPGQPETPPNSTKRLKVSQIQISRYQEEFVEICDLAKGAYGDVKLAKHRLDGICYAIKITKGVISTPSSEKAAVNEVFAHAALMKDKHIVRYFNSWAENDRIYIQNEYCESGNLADLIQTRRDNQDRFTESELKRMILHLVKGLDYIHSKGLVHLDIKPANIFLTADPVPSSPSGGEEDESEENKVDKNAQLLNAGLTPRRILKAEYDNDVEMISSTPSKLNKGAEKEPEAGPSADARPLPLNMFSTPKTSRPRIPIREEETAALSTDSGTAMEGPGGSMDGSFPSLLDNIIYKIGDLGHVSTMAANNPVEEGDCRYMGPELLGDSPNRSLLNKADMFSLGMSIYEAASLRHIPKNSQEDIFYNNMKEGKLPYLPEYSPELNNLIMVNIFSTIP